MDQERVDDRVKEGVVMCVVEMPVLVVIGPSGLDVDRIGVKGAVFFGRSER